MMLCTYMCIYLTWHIICSRLEVVFRKKVKDGQFILYSLIGIVFLFTYRDFEERELKETYHEGRNKAE